MQLAECLKTTTSAITPTCSPALISLLPQVQLPEFTAQVTLPTSLDSTVAPSDFVLAGEGGERFAVAAPTFLRPQGRVRDTQGHVSRELVDAVSCRGPGPSLEPTVKYADPYLVFLLASSRDRNISQLHSQIRLALTEDKPSSQSRDCTWKTPATCSSSCSLTSHLNSAPVEHFSPVRPVFTPSLFPVFSHSLVSNLSQTPKVETSQERSTSTPAEPMASLNSRSNSFESTTSGRPKSKHMKKSGSHSDIHRRLQNKQTCANKSTGTTPSTSNAMDCDDPGESVSSCRTSYLTLGETQVPMRETQVPMEIQNSDMFLTFQRWATKNYGDSGKTKTVTGNKYQRIVRILTGEEQFSAENSKFRFWVKAKGFRLSLDEGGLSSSVQERQLLVPSKHGVSSHGFVVVLCMCGEREWLEIQSSVKRYLVWWLEMMC